MTVRFIFILIIYFTVGNNDISAQVDTNNLKIFIRDSLVFDVDTLIHIRGEEKDSFCNYHRIHYSVQNVSYDTITFTTNYCPSIYQPELIYKDSLQVANRQIHCIASIEENHSIPPGEKFSAYCSFEIGNPEILKTGRINCTIILPLRVELDGRFVALNRNAHYSTYDLKFTGSIEVVEKFNVRKQRGKNKKS